jgi:hypothetical protein
VFETDETLDDKKLSLQRVLDTVNNMSHTLTDLQDMDIGFLPRLVQGRSEDTPT